MNKFKFLGCSGLFNLKILVTAEILLPHKTVLFFFVTKLVAHIFFKLRLRIELKRTTTAFPDLVEVFNRQKINVTSRMQCEQRVF